MQNSDQILSASPYNFLINFSWKLKKFLPLIESLKDTNLVIGGKSALRLHGIKMSCDPKDIDFIIYEPTIAQIAVLNHIRPFDITKRPDDARDYPIEKLKVMKFEIAGNFLDIIIEYKPMPNDLLCISVPDQGEFFVQSVDRVIDAKMSYAWDKKKEDGLHTFMRSKDLTDLIDLKNSNFNVS